MTNLQKQTTMNERATMSKVTNLDNKRVCDVSEDQKVVGICKKDCITRITANLDGTLNITHERIKTAV